MKIISLTSENIKKLRAVEIKPAGEIVTIAGRNGQGKTSILDSIWWALAGTAHVQSQPIRKGETKARIKLDLGEIVVERKFTSTGSTLAVESADGARYPSPQKMLDALLGELSFDPLAFARMEPRKQFDELRRVAKLEVDIDKLKALNRGDYDRRTEVNREAKAKRAQQAGVVIPPEVGSDVIDETALVDELQKAGEANAELATREEKRSNAAQAAARLRGEAKVATERAARTLTDGQAAYEKAIREAEAALDHAKQRARELNADAKTATDDADTLEKKLAAAPPLPAPIDVTVLRQRIEQARQTNKAIAARQLAVSSKDTYGAQAHTLEAQSQALTEQIEAREKAMQDAIASAAMPVDGLGFGDGVVTYNGIPFEQASSAEQLRVSMAIAIAANPKLRVIRITDGSLLDDDAMIAIGEMAKADDFQVWVERVSSDGKVGIVIDDGMVVSTPESRAELALEPGE